MTFTPGPERLQKYCSQPRMVHKMGGDWKKLQAREKVEQRWIFHPMYRCTVRDVGAKWFCLCFPEGKGLLKG